MNCIVKLNIIGVSKTQIAKRCGLGHVVVGYLMSLQNRHRQVINDKFIFKNIQ